MTVPFELGEQKHVRLRVCSCKNENFLITAASYELYYRGAKEPGYRTSGNPGTHSGHPHTAQKERHIQASGRV